MAHDPRYDRSEEVTEIRRDERRPPPPWWQEHWWIFLVVLLLIVGAIIAFFVLAGDDEEDDRALVPDVVGVQEAEARVRLEEAGFGVEVVREPADEEEGVVFAQTPGAGSRLDEGETVQIDVSSGPEEVLTETVTETETQAETETRAETQTQEETQTQTVEAEPETTTMADLVGQSYADASATAIDAGLLPDGFAVPAGEEAGTVVAQNPDAGTELDVGTSVRLNVSLGGEERPSQEVPDVTGPELAEAYARCVDAGFTCRVVVRDAPSDEEVGEIIDQRPAAGATARRWAQVTLALGT